MYCQKCGTKVADESARFCANCGGELLLKQPTSSFSDVPFKINAAEQNAASPEETASYLVQYFYESINSGDFVTAYSLLGSHWQSKTDFSTFRNGYLDTRSASIDGIQTSKDGSNVSVAAILTAEERKDGNDVYSKYKLQYTVGYENDQMKILSGSGKKIQ